MHPESSPHAPIGSRDGTGAAPLSSGIPIGSVVPRSFTGDSRLVVLNRTHSATAERYRRLCSKLDVSRDRAPRSSHAVLVTSGVPGEGKTTTAANLAMALAEDRDRRVVLVDGDLRRPSVGHYLEPAPEVGLGEILAGEASLDDALVQPANSSLAVLPGGTPATNPLHLLRSDDLTAVFAELRRRYDVIVVDAPPCVPFADPAVLLTVCDGAILVVRARSTARAVLERAIEALEGGTLLGVVLNDVAVTPVDRYYYRYDAYDPYAYARREEKAGSDGEERT